MKKKLTSIAKINFISKCTRSSGSRVSTFPFSHFIQSGNMAFIRIIASLLFVLTTMVQPVFAQTSASLIDTYLRSIQEKNQWQTSDINDWIQTDSYTDRFSGLTHTYINQCYHHIPVYRGISALTIKDNVVAYFAPALTAHLQEKVNTDRPTFSAREAIDFALNSLVGKNASYAELSDFNEDLNTYFFDVPEFSDHTVKVQLVYQPATNEVLLAWNVSIEMKNSSDWWNIRVNALNGEYLEKDNYTVECNAEYTVFPYPTEAPSFGSRSLLCDPANVVASPFGWHDVDGISGAEYTMTRGNNVYAYEDANNDNLPGYSPSSATLQFNFPLDFNQPPLSNQDASITNLFYANNRIHDYLYALGFTEEAGNFQENNYGHGGQGNDYVKAEAFDGSGTNNANFNTPPDGNPGRMQMYLWNGYCSTLQISSSSFNGSMNIGTAAFTSIGSASGDLVLADDGTATITDACQALVTTPTNPFAGKIVLIDRGTCPFIYKAQQAVAAGAIAVIIVNNVAGGAPAMSGSPQLGIPVISVSQADGNILKAAMLAGTVTATIQTCTAAKDASFDNGIIAHEYGHGVSNRLTGGPMNTFCLSNAEQGGEGWSDWLTLMMTIEPSDIGPGFLNQGRTVGTYVQGQLVSGSGIRNFPYCTNMVTNPLTYADLGGALLGTQVHNIGEVWCSALWDLSSFLINDLGFNADPTMATAGNNIAVRLVLEGMKLQPCQPGFLDARDAILMADNLLYNNVHRCRLWEAFARRGMGYNALQGSSTNANDQTAGFALPPFCLAVIQAPIAAFTSDLTTTVCAGSIKFTDASTNVFDWHWDFGDSTSSTLQHPSHQYNSPGTYFVKLLVTNPLGSDSMTQTIIITPTYTVNVTATPNTVCPGNPVALGATSTGGSSTYFSNYTLSSIPYATIAGTFTNIALGDDVVSSALPIGFPFNFFGQMYTNFYISSNGFITFSSNQQPFPAYGQVLPFTQMPNNLIALAWNDLNPLNAGSSVGYLLSGSSPNQKLVIRYITSHYGGTFYPFEVEAILSEGSNTIEIHTTTISDASAYDPTATTTQGVENIDGTVAVMVAGRNGAVFSASNDAWLFTPTAPVYSYTWLPGNLSGSTQTVTPVSTTNYTVNVADGGGCVMPVSSPVVVNIAPTFTTCPTTMNAYTASNACSNAVSYTASASGSPLPSLTYSFANATTGSGTGDGSGSTFNKGTTTVTLTATNACGSATCSFDVVVTDATAPTISCPLNVAVNNDLGACGAVVSFLELITSENCSYQNYTLTQSSSQTIAGGMARCTYTPTGFHANNSYYRVFNLPSLGIPSYQIDSVNVAINIANSPSGSQPMVVNLHTLSGAFVLANLTLLNTQTIMVPNMGAGMITIPISALVPANSVLVVEVNSPDGSANSNDLRFGRGVGETAPTYFAGGCGINEPVTWASLTFPTSQLLMNVFGRPPYLQTTGLASGSLYPVGTTINTFVTTDASGNSSSCSFTVTVADTTKPTITCPGNITQANDAGVCGATITYATPVGTDNCASTTAQTEGLASGSIFPLGITVNKFVVTDASGNKDSCSFTVTVLGVPLQAKVFLDGPYIGGGLMHDSLRIKNLIPSTEPYSGAPFNKTPIGDLGGETVSSGVLSITGNNAIVDWVFLELRSASNPSSVVANKRALIQRDGDIVGTDGMSTVLFANTMIGNYYVSVKHRNHLGVMTMLPISLGCSTSLLDFTVGSVYSNPLITNAPRKSLSSVYTLWTSDANNNKNVKYNGLNSDKDVVLSSVGGPSNLNATVNNVYRTEDVNMDGKVRFNNTDNDRSVILNTVGVSTPNIIFNQHTPN